MHRYQVRAEKETVPADVAPLERAFARMTSGDQEVLRRAAVAIVDGHLVVEMELTGSRRNAVRAGEDAFATAWYDAFGERGSSHLGRLVEPPA